MVRSISLFYFSFNIMKNTDKYEIPLTAGEECMVSKLRSEFEKRGMFQQMVQFYDCHPDILSSLGKTQNVQRFHINRWIFEQLIYFPGDSVSVRLALANDGPIEPWFELIRQVIVPFFSDNNLPVAVPSF